MFRRAPVTGDTLRTRTEVVALRQSSARPDWAATGLVALRISPVDQQDRSVLDFWRCAMLPLRDGQAHTGHADDLAQVGAEPRGHRRGRRGRQVAARPLPRPPPGEPASCRALPSSPA